MLNFTDHHTTDRVFISPNATFGLFGREGGITGRDGSGKSRPAALVRATCKPMLDFEMPSNLALRTFVELLRRMRPLEFVLDGEPSALQLRIHWPSGSAR